MWLKIRGKRYWRVSWPNYDPAGSPRNPCFNILLARTQPARHPSPPMPHVVPDANHVRTLLIKPGHTQSTQPSSPAPLPLSP